jgi:aminopeptidase-like protein
LYPTFSTKTTLQQETLKMINLLSFCDGEHSLLDIAEKLSLPAWDLYEIIEKLVSHDLISSK